ncbi:hypothetical protein [Streptomyces sp. Tue6028]|uniref:hypothetical protein n=1 Tax=Streptomyces sp. Tue6028 TaxID=2036037 RepID=UPI003EC1516B
MKNLLYEVYLEAGAPTLDEIAGAIEDDESAPGAPSRDTVRRVICDPSLPPGQADVVSIAGVLARRARWDEQDLGGRVRDLWVAARMAEGAGRPVAAFDDRLVLADLEVHPALDAGSARDGSSALPAYVRREFNGRLDAVVEDAVNGRSGIAVLVGGSSTGKTRALWEAVRDLPAPWRLWHPLAPTRPDAVLAALDNVAPCTVVWLNEAQHYLSPDLLGEQVAAALRDLLHDPSRAPVLVLATLWPGEWDTLTVRGAPDRHPQARELLTAHEIHVPEAFSQADMAVLAGSAGVDPRLAEAAERAQDHQVAQYLAGVPVLMGRYRRAEGATLALIHAAMDARRLGAGPHIPLAWLADAAPGYLTDTQWTAAASGDWLAEALTYVTKDCNGIAGILTPVQTGTPRNQRRRRPDADTVPVQYGQDPHGPAYQLADYLDQYGRRHRATEIPPVDFWTAAATHARPTELDGLGDAAWNRGLYRDATQLHKRATTHGSTYAPVTVIEHAYDVHPTDRRPAQWVVQHASLADPYAVAWLLGVLWGAGADDQVTALLARNPGTHTSLANPHAVANLLNLLREVGADDQVTALLARNPGTHTSVDDPHAVADLLHVLREVGADDHITALLARDPAAHTSLANPHAVASLVDALSKVGADDQVTTLTTRAAVQASLANMAAVADLLHALREVGADDQITTLTTRAATHTSLANPHAVANLLDLLRVAGADDQVTALLARDPAANASVEDPVAVASLLDALRKVEADGQVTALATRAVARVSVIDGYAVARLLGVLRKVEADDQVTALATRAVAPLSSDDGDAAARLLNLLRAAMRPSGHEPYAVGLLLDALQRLPPDDLAQDPATHASVDDPSAVASLLDALWEVGADGQVTALLARDPAANASVEDPFAVASLLDALREVGAGEQVTTLASRAAMHASLNDSAAVARLLITLRNAEAGEQIAVLATRLPGVGLFSEFTKIDSHAERFRFGREPDGSAAVSWTWDDLE